MPRSIGWCGRTIWSARRPRTCCSTWTTRRATRRRARRSHPRHRAVPGRTRRLAGLPALTAGRPDPRARGRWRSPRASARETGLDVEVMWGDDGFVVRFPEGDRLPDPLLAHPGSRRSRGTAPSPARCHLAVRGTLPRSRRACAAPAAAAARHADAALAAAQASGGPARRGVALRLVSDAARDLSGNPPRPLRHARRWSRLLARVRSRAIRVRTIDSPAPSPFAASLLFNYVANYLYDGDAPLAERRAQALSVDPGTAAGAARAGRAARAARHRRHRGRRTAAPAPRRPLQGPNG